MGNKRRRSTLYSYQDVIDLSMVDNVGRYHGKMTTANCYLVHKAGKYKFPLVFGNGIRNGEVNMKAIHPGNETTDTYLADMQVYGTGGSYIISPWMCRPTEGNLGQGYELGGVKLVWQDQQGLITEVSYEGDYFYFTVGTFQEGNAVVAILGLSNQIMWSWHIWATNETLENTSRVNTGNQIYDVAPVNLGWVKTGGTTTYPRGYNTYYQFERKDPFIPYDGSADKTVYDIDGNVITGLEYLYKTSGYSTYTISYILQYPTTIIALSNNYSWFYNNYANLWDALSDAWSSVTTPTVKTIYDPCPPGFCVPTNELYNYMVNSDSSNITWNSTYKGVTYTNVTGNNLWFPANGYRQRSNNGAISGYGTRGDYGTVNRGGSGNGNYRYFHFTNSEKTYTTFYRSVTTCIRPVKEEFIGLHDYVEIGGMKWATMNIGASSITDTGYYFQWGDQTSTIAANVGSGTDQKYFGSNWSDYIYTSSLTKYNNTDEKTTLDFKDDAAIMYWGGAWRMPTNEEFNALLNATDFIDSNGNTITGSNKYTTLNGVTGIYLADKNDHSKRLFFPTCGYANNGSIQYTANGYYWARNISINDGYEYAYLLQFSSSVFGIYAMARYTGFQIRPILDM